MSDMKSLSGIQFMDSGAIMRAVNGGGGTMSQPQAVRPRIVCSKANACRFRLLARFVCAYKKLSVPMPYCTHHRQCSSKLARTSWPPRKRRLLKLYLVSDISSSYGCIRQRLQERV